MGKNVAKLDYLLVDVATSQLLKGHLRVDRVEVDGLAADVTVDANGAFDFGLPPSPRSEESWESGAEAGRAPESRPAATAAADLDFKFPIEVKAIRISHVIANFRDDTVSPPVAAQVGVDVRVTDLGVPGSPASASVRVASPQFLETLRVDAEEFLNDGNLTGRVDVRIRGFQPRVIGAELARIGIQPRCDLWQSDLGVTAAAQATRVTGPDGKTTSKYPVETQVTLRDIRVECDRDVPVSLERLAAKGKWIHGNWLTAIEATLENVRGSMETMPDGGIAAVGFEFGGGGPPASSPAVPPPAPAPIPNNPPAAGGESFVAEVTSFHATNLDCHIDDSGAGSLVDWNAVVDEIKIRGFSLDPAKNRERTSIFVKLHAPGAIQLLQLEGRWRRSPTTASATSRSTSRGPPRSDRSLHQESWDSLRAARRSLRCQDSCGARHRRRRHDRRRRRDQGARPRRRRPALLVEAPRPRGLPLQPQHSGGLDRALHDRGARYVVRDAGDRGDARAGRPRGRAGEPAGGWG